MLGGRRQVSWLPGCPAAPSRPGSRPTSGCAPRGRVRWHPRSQWRVRAGFAPDFPSPPTNERRQCTRVSSDHARCVRREPRRASRPNLRTRAGPMVAARRRRANMPVQMTTDLETEPSMSHFAPAAQPSPVPTDPPSRPPRTRLRRRRPRRCAFAIPGAVFVDRRASRGDAPAPVQIAKKGSVRHHGVASAIPWRVVPLTSTRPRTPAPISPARASARRAGRAARGCRSPCRWR